MTYRSLLQQAQKTCDKSYIEYLLQGITNRKIHELYLDSSTVPQEIIDKFNQLIQAKKTDKPIQYLLQKAYFLSYELYVDERVMIPRFETEELVMRAAPRLKNVGQCFSPTNNSSNLESLPYKILDIGTGSGAIAIALADIFPQAELIATDISQDALEVAKININRYTFQDRIKLYCADLFPNKENVRFDLIISNPPYIPENEIEKLSSTVKDYEPHLALNGGKNGFEIIERIITQAHKYLAADGLLALEIDPRQAALIKCRISNSKLHMSAQEFEKDNQEMIRYAFIRYKKLNDLE